MYKSSEFPDEEILDTPDLRPRGGMNSQVRSGVLTLGTCTTLTISQTPVL